ncbi:MULTISPECIES: DUF1816 domain-containing protein [unclassified Acaryochloris]|uniref:DUF1816 domain-containing protein n=1 Tax=unclassified Acaryochloris TaxID=2631661 RepID=UPI00024843F3|nr:MULTISPECIES: DUF1816 domain-containing protein [unclassified Acaryochloris]KAI9129704.1 DUF1816 domain-containing protein [Acaryochloris sp. CCMEE 5410]
MLWIYSQKQAPFWWIEVVALEPQSTLYYGPFRTSTEAANYQANVTKDMKAEPQKITVTIRTCQPEILAITSIEAPNREPPFLPER